MGGVALLVVAWIAATQPFGAPDEASHYVRALSITNGQILGRKVRYTSYQLTPPQEAWANHDTRGVIVPARLNPPNMRCANGRPNITGSCLVQTVSGNYPPLPFLLPAAGLAVSHDTSTAIWVTRAASAVPAIAFLLLAIALLWDGTAWSIFGLLAAISPMVFWVSSVLNPSGMQITACLALTAAAIRIARAPREAPRWAWLAFTISGAAAILSGPIGLEFTIFELLVFGAFLMRGGIRELRAATSPRVLRASALTLIVAAGLAMIYSRIAGFAATFQISPLIQGLHQGVLQISPVLRGAVGIFGALTVFLPLTAYWVWWLMVLTLVAVALWLGNRQERVMTVSVLVLALAFPVFFYAWIVRFTGFGLQAREVLPPLTLIPLVAGEVVYRNRARIADRQSAQALLAGGIGLIAVFQAYAWWYDARIVAGAPGTIRFYAHAVWSPPGGWTPWIASAALGSIAFLGLAATEGLRGFASVPSRSPMSPTPSADRAPVRQ